MDHSHIPAPTSAHPAGRALVLGGGGALGNAWLVGVLSGLAEAGPDVTASGPTDLVVGTSAGATAAAQLASATAPDLFHDVLREQAPTTPSAASALPVGRPSAGTVGDHLARTAALIAASSDLRDMRRRIGASAVELAEAAGEQAQARWRATVAARLRGTEWPDHALVLTAVDALTGDETLLDRESGVDLVDAVAASTSGGAAYRVGDRWLVDGGYRTNADNADLASGRAAVLVLSPLGGRSRLPAEWGLRLVDQVALLRAGGSEVVTVLPDEASLEVFGQNMMDVGRRADAARAGRDQGLAVAAEVAAVWR